MENTYTIKDITETTGLKEQYIRKFIMESKGEFDKYIVSRGKNNTILFDSNALVIFDKVKQRKENGAVVPDIVSWLFQNNGEKTTIETSNNQENNPSIKDYIKRFDEMHKEVILAKEETIKTKDEHILNLNRQLLLLTDGKNPDEYRKEQERKQEEFFKLKIDVKNKEEQLAVLRNNEEKIKAIEAEKQRIEQLKNEELEKEKDTNKRNEELITKYKNDFSSMQENIRLTEEKVKQLEEKEKHKAELLQQLKELEGKWFVGSQRTKLLQELESIT